MYIHIFSSISLLMNIHHSLTVDRYFARRLEQRLHVSRLVVCSSSENWNQPRKSIFDLSARPIARRKCYKRVLKRTKGLLYFINIFHNLLSFTHIYSIFLSFLWDLKHLYYFHAVCYFRDIVPHDFAHSVARLWVSFSVRRIRVKYRKKWREGVRGGTIAEIDDEDSVEDAVT